MPNLIATLILDWRTGILIPLLAWAAFSDCRSHRIPNWLVLSGMAFGVICNTALPPSAQDGILFPLMGLGLGLLLFLPLYILRAMGAGDVKLAAMVGAFLGPGDTFNAMLVSMIAGGALAVCYALAGGVAATMLRNLASLFRVVFLDLIGGAKPQLQIDAARSAGKLPYGVAITVGTIAYLVLHQAGFLYK
jgi:prepilin peptidase CpaA